MMHEPAYNFAKVDTQYAEKLAAAIKEARSEHGLALKQLAFELELSESSAYTAENPKTLQRMSTDRMRLICEYLGVEDPTHGPCNKRDRLKIEPSEMR